MFFVNTYKQMIVLFSKILFFCSVSKSFIKCSCRRLTIFCFVFFFTNACLAQFNIGIPDIKNYTRTIYKAGSQNWAIGQDANGIMYFGNNEGLLTFDGYRWRLYPLPLKGNIRSLAIDKNKIYVGGQEELGFFVGGDNGDLSYHSLKYLIPKEYRRDFAEVWNIIVANGTVFFRSNRHVFVLEKGKISAFQSYNWSFLGNINGQVFAFDDSKGLCEYDSKGNWKTVIEKSLFPKNVQINGLMLINGAIWIATYNDGIYKWIGNDLKVIETPSTGQLKNQMIYGMVALSPSEIAFTTNLNGCFVLDTLGNYVTRYTHQEGLQNNNVICSYVDKDHNLWLGLSDGIDIVEYGKPIRSISPGENGSIAGYSSGVFRGQLFLGTATGVYQYGHNTNNTMSSGQLLPFTNGQNLNITPIDNDLWIGQYKSAIVYSNERTQVVNRLPTGFWNFQKLPGTDYVIAGTYNGIHYFRSKDGRVEDIGIEALFESAKYVVATPKVIWAMHPYKGLYRVDLSNKGLPIKITHIYNAPFLAKNNNHLFKIGDRVVLTSERGIYEWDAQKDSFIPSDYFKSIFHNISIDYLVMNERKEYWFISNGEMGVALPEKDKYRIVYFPDLNGRLQFGENQSIMPFNDSCAIVAAEKGFFYVDYIKYKSQKKSFPLLIRSFHIQTPNKDSILFGGYTFANEKMPKLSYQYNSVLLTYAVPVFGYAPPIEYSYRLEGFDQTWSVWSEKSEKSYTNLPPGNYRFLVRAKNSYNNNIKQTNFSFVVMAPWYRSVVAYTCYFLILVIGVYWFSLFQHKRYIAMQEAKLKEQKETHDRREQQLSLHHSLLQEKKEKQLAEMTNEKLAIELEMKNTTIASNAMLLIQKGELLSKVKKDLSSLLDMGNASQTSSQIKKIIRTVESELNNKEDWEKFASHFDSVHENYLKKLKENYPQLTYSDLKLCALLRLGMSSKEIASVLNISLKGVEVSRYRLRKKLHMEEEQSLFDFLMQ
ncbi:MAG: hypothetical protein DI598_00865 [Pseudopedobacter saltans]|uniref:HTH luxR-type domain-containing protein n=1 Tax=Pseudopedobacter saltans TaxID=151895 RepID=A0A2W5FBM2_9SPHI|nr:MAG: hypothetical protein DI598_00865 [Pseudopedobacter saltans]